MVEVLEHEGAEGSEAGLAAAQVPHGGNQQVGLLLGRGQQLHQLQELLVAGHAQGEPLVQQRPAASLPLGEASIALGDRHLDQFYGLLVRSGLSSTTVLQLHRILHHALRDAMRWNLVARNVAELVTPPRRAHHNFVTFGPEQARRFLEAVKGDRLGALYILALTTGMREGELFGLRWADVSLRRRRAAPRQAVEDQILAPPGPAHARRSGRAYPPSRHPARGRRQLGPAWDEQGLVFPNTAGRPLHSSNFLQRSFYPLLERAGLPRIRFHDLRHEVVPDFVELEVAVPA
jgi:integrase